MTVKDCIISYTYQNVTRTTFQFRMTVTFCCPNCYEEETKTTGLDKMYRIKHMMMIT